MRIAVLTPTYSGNVSRHYHYGMTDVGRWCREKGHELIPILVSGCGLIDQVRNNLLAKAREYDPDEIVFIDDDVGFTANEFEKLLSHDVEMVGGVYRHKLEKESYPTQVIENGQRKGDLVQVTHLPAGFMRIRRDGLARMLVKYGKTNECWYRNHAGRYKCLHLFAQGMAFTGDDETDIPSYVGEDVHFCNLFQAAGGTIWADKSIKLTHTGEKTYEGDFGGWLDRDLATTKTESQ